MRLSLILWTWPSQKKHALPDGGVHIGEISTSPKIIVNNYELEMVDTFTYLGAKISSKLSLDRELDKQIYGLEQPLHLPALEQMCGKIPD